MDIYVTNLPFKVSEEELKAFFEKYGLVENVVLIKDHKTRQNKGYGFVYMPNEPEAQAAISAANGADLNGRKIVVTLSQKKKEAEKPKAHLPFWQRKKAPPKRLVTFGDETKPKPKKKKKGQGRGTKY